MEEIEEIEVKESIYYDVLITPEEGASEQYIEEYNTEDYTIETLIEHIVNGAYDSYNYNEETGDYDLSAYKVEIELSPYNIVYYPRTKELYNPYEDINRNEINQQGTAR